MSPLTPLSSHKNKLKYIHFGVYGSLYRKLKLLVESLHSNFNLNNQLRRNFYERFTWKQHEECQSPLLLVEAYQGTFLNCGLVLLFYNNVLRLTFFISSTRYSSVSCDGFNTVLPYSSTTPRKNLIALSRDTSSPLRICENNPPMVPEG